MIQTSHCHFLIIIIFLPLKFISLPRPDLLSAFIRFQSFERRLNQKLINTCICATNLFDWSQTLCWYLFIHVWCNANFQFAWSMRPIKKRRPWNLEPFACYKKWTCERYLFITLPLTFLLYFFLFPPVWLIVSRQGRGGAICRNTALLSVTNQMPAFIPLIVSAMARCKCQMWPCPASLAPNVQPSTSSVCQNPPSANDASVFIILARDGGVIQTSFCSAFFGLTLWNAPVSVRPDFSHPAWSANVAFITQIMAVKGSGVLADTDPCRLINAKASAIHLFMCDLIYHTCHSWAALISQKLLVEIPLTELFNGPCNYSLWSLFICGQNSGDGHMQNK